MRQLNETQIRQIQILLGYSTRQLHPNSNLRQRIKRVESDDRSYGLTVISDIQTNLTAIAEIELKIDAIKASGSDSLSREKVDDDYEVSYRTSKDAAAGLKEQRSRLVDRLAQDLDLYRVQHSGRKLRS